MSPFTKIGPKRRRRCRRQMWRGEGNYSQLGSCQIHFKREREAKRAPKVSDWTDTKLSPTGLE